MMKLVSLGGEERGVSRLCLNRPGNSGELFTQVQPSRPGCC